jgi:hypothetical protein
MLLSCSLNSVTFSSRLLTIIISTIVFCYSCNLKKEYSQDEIETLIKTLTAENVNSSAENVKLNSLVTFDDFFDSSHYAASISLIDDESQQQNLIILEISNKGKANIIIFNPYILNTKSKNGSKYQLSDDSGQFAYGFRIGNAEVSYRFVLRPQEDDQEVLFCDYFTRKLDYPSHYVIDEFKQDIYAHLSFKEFDSITEQSMVSYTHNKTTHSLQTTIPNILSNSKEFYLLNPLEGTITNYIINGEINKYKITDIKLLPSSEKEILLNLNVTNEAGAKEDIYIKYKSSLSEYQSVAEAAVAIDTENNNQLKEDLYPIEVSRKDVVDKFRDDGEEEYNKLKYWSFRDLSLIMSYYLTNESEVVSYLACNINDDEYTDYLVMTQQTDTQFRYSLFLFLGNKNQSLTLDLQENTNTLLGGAMFEQSNCSTKWIESAFDHSKLRMIVANEEPQKDFRNSTRYIEFNYSAKDHKLHLNKYFGYSSSEGRSIFQAQYFQKGYTISDFWKSGNICKSEKRLNYTIFNTSENDDWFRQEMLSENNSDSIKTLIAMTVYDPTLKISFDQEYYSILEYLCQHKNYDEALTLLDRISPEEKESKEYTLTYYWYGYLYYLQKNYDMASAYIDNYMAQCQKYGEAITDNARDIKQNADKYSN